MRARYTTRVGASKLASPAKGRGMRGFKRIIVMTTVAATALIGPAVGITGAQASVENIAVAGQAIPLKFRVTSGGIPVTDLTSVDVSVDSLSCAGLGTTADQIEEYATGGSGLINQGDGYYQFNWKTPKGYAKSCKTLMVDMGDGVNHTAIFRFTK